MLREVSRRGGDFFHFPFLSCERKQTKPLALSGMNLRVERTVEIRGKRSKKRSIVWFR